MTNFKVINILIIWQTFAEYIQGLQYHMVYFKVIQINFKNVQFKCSKIIY